MLDVDAAPTYVTEASVYVYDSEGNYISRIDVPQTKLKANNHRIKVEGLPEGDYQFVVWCGTSNNTYTMSGDKESMSKFQLALAKKDTVSTSLPNLFHGYLATVHYDDTSVSHDVYLTKNTNQLACLVVVPESGVTLKPEDYDMQIVSANSTMDAYNNVVSTEETVYLPFVKDTVTIDEGDNGLMHGIEFSLSTLRLMKDKKSHLIFKRVGSSTPVFDISFTEYLGVIGTLYTQLGKELTVQEYLDRQDFHTIVFYLSDDASVLISLKVNNWKLRLKDYLYL